ncbi:MAG: GNAT family N-acetyltransferase [Bacteroidia bacterium]|nr:GNAT family N-acetyltransferase [Bacteroidia bacterium]
MELQPQNDHNPNLVQAPLPKAIFPTVRPGVKRLLRLKKLDEIYDQVKGTTSSPDEFAKTVLEILKVDYVLPERELKALREIQGPLVVIANLPFGGIEALIMVRLLAAIRPEFKLVANNLLGQVSELKSALVLVDPFRDEQFGQAAEAEGKILVPLKQLVKQLKEGGLIGMFPAGAQASFNFQEGIITVPGWDHDLGRIIRMTEATVVPIYFHAPNPLYIKIAGFFSQKLASRLMFRKLMAPHKKKVHFQIGRKITPARLSKFTKAEEMVQFLQSKTYLLSAKYQRSGISVNAIDLPHLSREVPIIDPVDPALFTREIDALPPSRILAEKAPFQVIEVNKKEAPHLMREIGRLREITFREVGEGSGKAFDVDPFDEYYTQLVLWDAEKKAVAGGYRIGKIPEILRDYGRKGVYTFSLFRIRKRLFEQIGPALEMGRSYVVREYQRSYLPLMLLWTAIGQYVLRNPRYKTLLGPVSITADLNPISTHVLVSFLEENQMDEELTRLVSARNKWKAKEKILKNYYNSFTINDLGDVQELIEEIENSSLGVPILLKHYLKLGGKLLAFNIDPDFSNVLDGLIMVDLTQTPPNVLRRYMGDEGMKKFLETNEK